MMVIDMIRLVNLPSPDTVLGATRRRGEKQLYSQQKLQSGAVELSYWGNT